MTIEERLRTRLFYSPLYFKKMVQSNSLTLLNASTLTKQNEAEKTVSASDVLDNWRSFESKTKTPMSYWLWHSKGISSLQAKQWKQAILYFDRAIAISPNHPEAWYGRGDALANLERYAEALANFNRAIQLAPECHKTWVFRGVVLIHLGDYRSALESCERAIEIQPSEREAWLFRGAALQKLGRYKEAYASFDRAAGKPQQLPLRQRLLERIKRLGHITNGAVAALS